MKSVMINMILAFVVIIVGLALFPTVVSSTTSANFTGALAFLNTLIPLGFGLGILGVSIGLIYTAFKHK